MTLEVAGSRLGLLNNPSCAGWEHSQTSKPGVLGREMSSHSIYKHYMAASFFPGPFPVLENQKEETKPTTLAQSNGKGCRVIGSYQTVLDTIVNKPIGDV